MDHVFQELTYHHLKNSKSPEDNPKIPQNTLVLAPGRRCIIYFRNWHTTPKVQEWAHKNVKSFWKFLSSCFWKKVNHVLWGWSIPSLRWPVEDGLQIVLIQHSSVILTMCNVQLHAIISQTSTTFVCCLIRLFVWEKFQAYSVATLNFVFGCTRSRSIVGSRITHERKTVIHVALKNQPEFRECCQSSSSYSFYAFVLTKVKRTSQVESGQRWIGVLSSVDFFWPEPDLFRVLLKALQHTYESKSSLNRPLLHQPHYPHTYILW